VAERTACDVRMKQRPALRLDAMDAPACRPAMPDSFVWTIKGCFRIIHN
jgi:hypothetical protein